MKRPAAAAASESAKRPKRSAKQVADPAARVKLDHPAEWTEHWQDKFGEGWFKALEEELRLSWFKKLMDDVQETRAKAKEGAAIFPPEEFMFRAFKETPLEAVRVVIVGQDPYHQPGQAMGLSFSVPRGTKVPPSLQNMLKEAGCWDPEAKASAHGDLTSWAQQGVFLLNSMLTVQESKPMSHKHLGWEQLTDHTITALSRDRKGIIFLLWGREAQDKAKLIDKDRHTIRFAGHPSPLSYHKHFKGCGHFSKVNEILLSVGAEEIKWQLPD